MHLCHINLPTEYYNADSAGAVARVISESSQAVEQKGHRVTVVTRPGGGPPLPGGATTDLEVRSREQLSPAERVVSRVLSRLKRWDWAYYDHHVRATTDALNSLDHPPDVVFAHNDLVAPSWLRRAAPRAARVVWLHNELTHTRQRGVSKSLDAADGVVAVSRHMAAWAGELGYRADRIAVVPNGANPAVFRPRADWDSPSGPVRVLFLGRIEPNKGPDLVVDAYQSLRSDGLAVDLTIAGGVWWHGEDGGEYWDRVRAEAVAAGAAWLGRVQHTEAATLMREHDVLCLPSRTAEGYPLVIAEAKASGLAVITSDRGGQVEAGGGAALLVHPEQPGSVTDALRRLVTRPQALLAAKSASLDESRSTTWEHTADLLIASIAALKTPARNSAPSGSVAG